MATAWICSCHLYVLLLQAVCPGKAGTSSPACLVSLFPSLSMQCILPCPMPSGTICPGPSVSRTSLQTFSHLSMFFNSANKMDLLSYFPDMTSVEKWLQIRAFFPIADINSDNCAFNSVSLSRQGGNG